MTDSEEFSGRLEAAEFVELRPRVAGVIERIHFEDGALVDKGQLLFSTPLFYVHAVMQAVSRIDLPLGHAERAVYVVSGSLEFGAVIHRLGQMLVFAPGSRPSLRALEASTVMLLGGEPLGERHIWWNFVSSRKDRIEQAKADWQAGRIALPPNDRDEFIPLP